jgi:hypothetical protein
MLELWVDGWGEHDELLHGELALGLDALFLDVLLRLFRRILLPLSFRLLWLLLGILAYEFGFAVDNLDSSFCTGYYAESASVAFLFVNSDYIP